MAVERVKIIGGGCSRTGKRCRQKAGCGFMSTGFGCAWSQNITVWRERKPRGRILKIGSPRDGRNVI